MRPEESQMATVKLYPRDRHEKNSST